MHAVRRLTSLLQLSKRPTRVGATGIESALARPDLRRAAMPLVAMLAAFGCNDPKCDDGADESCDDAESDNPTKPSRDDTTESQADAAPSELVSSSAPDAGSWDETEQPYLYCDGGAAALPISDAAEIKASCETAGIGGWWYCFEDGINPSGCTKGELPFDAEREGLCLSGSTTVDPEYVAWGAGVGLTLNEGSGGRRPWNATARNIVGFRIVMTGETNGLKLRVILASSANVRDEDPMIDLAGPGEYEVLFENVFYPGASPRAGEMVDPTALYDAQVMVVGAELATTYDFCLTAISPVYGE